MQTEYEKRAVAAAIRHARRAGPLLNEQSFTAFTNRRDEIEVIVDRHAPPVAVFRVKQGRLHRVS